MRASQHRTQKRRLAVALSGLCLLASACSGFGPDDPRAGLSCVDDSPECVDRRQANVVPAAAARRSGVPALSR